MPTFWTNRLPHNIYLSLPRWRFGTTFSTYTIFIPLAIAESCHGDWLPALSNTYRNLLPAASRNPRHTGSYHGAGWLPALSNTCRNLPFLPAASRNPRHTGSYHGAGWLPALSNTCTNLPFLPAASWNPGHKTTVILPLSRWWTNIMYLKQI